MGYVSNEFALNVPSAQSSPTAACVVSTTTATSLWLASNGYGPGGGVNISSVVLDSVEQGACTSPDAWHTTQLQVDGWGATTLATGAGMGLCVPSNPILVWNNGNDLRSVRHGIWAAEYGGGNQPEEWAVPVQLLTKDQGNPGIDPASDSVSVSATAWGPGCIIVACPQTSSGDVYLGSYVLGDRDTASRTWVAAYERVIPVAQIAAALPGVADTGVTVSCDWFPSGETDAHGPVGHLVVCLNPAGGGGPVVGYVQLVVDPDGVPQVDSTHGQVVWDRLPGQGPAVVARDPAGRVRAYSIEDGQLVTQTFSTAETPASTGFGGHALPLVRTDTRPAPHGRSIPAVTFAVLPGTATIRTLATVVDSSGVASLEPVQAGQVRAFELVVYQDKPTEDPTDHLTQPATYAQIGTFGWGQALTTAGVPSRSSTAVLPGTVIRGIVDGPIPIPLGNVEGANELAELKYSSTRTDTVDHHSETSWTTGVKSTGEPSSGLGPVWDISVSSGTGSVTDSSSAGSTTTSAAQPTSTFVDANGATVMDQSGWVCSAQSSANYTVNRWIESVGSTADDRPAAQLCADGVYRVYARHGTRLQFYLGVPAGQRAIQWAMDDITWENDKQGPAAVAGVPAAAADPFATSGTGHVWTRDSFGSVLRFGQTPQGWTDLFDPAGVGIGPFGGDPVPFLVGDVEHVLVVDSSGHLWDVHPGDDQGGWGAVDLSATQKPPMVCRTAPMAHPAVSVSDNGNGTWAVTVLFPSQQGHLFMLYNADYPSLTGWTYDDLSYEVKAAAGGWVTIDSDVTRAGEAVISTGTMATGSTGHIQQWSWHPSQGSQPAGWECTDVSTSVGNTTGEPWPQILGSCAVLPADPARPGTVSVLARRTDGHLLLVSQQDDQPWTHLDLSEYAAGGVAVAGDPVAVDPGTVVVVATDGHLMWVTGDPSSAGSWEMTDITVAAGANPGGPAVITDPTSGSGQTPQWVAFTSTYTEDGTPTKYPLYGPVAGDLLSYTPHSWNTRMAALGPAWNRTKRATDDPLYEGGEYITDVVLRHAHRFTDDSTSLSALWTDGPTTAPAYQAVKTGFTENTWTLDASFYMGVGWGGLPEGADAVGIFGNEAWSVMAGGSIHVQRTTTATEQTTWGISISGPTSPDRWGPPPLPGGAGPGIVAAYTFDLYYLPPPTTELPATYWTTELRAGLASLPADAWPPGAGYVDTQAIDPGSGAWKVMFVLTSYTAGPTLTLDPPDPAPGLDVTLSGTFYGMDCAPAELVLTTGGTPTAPLTVVHDYGTIITLDPNGGFGAGAEEPATTVTIPTGLAPGTYTLRATVPGSTPGEAAFTVPPTAGP